MLNNNVDRVSKTVLEVVEETSVVLPRGEEVDSLRLYGLFRQVSGSRTVEEADSYINKFDPQYQSSKESLELYVKRCILLNKLFYNASVMVRKNEALDEKDKITQMRTVYYALLSCLIRNRWTVGNS